VLAGVASCAARLDGRLLRWEVVAPQPRPRELPHALRVTESTESGAAVVDQLLVAHLGRPEELPIALFRLAPVEAHAARQQLVPRGEQALCEGVLGSHRLAVVRRLPLLLARSTQRTTLLGLRLTTARLKPLVQRVRGPHILPVVVAQPVEDRLVLPALGEPALILDDRLQGVGDLGALPRPW